MFLIPRHTQLSGATFLTDRPTALLADWPRVGKTGTALIAADMAFKRTILIITTASGRAVWRRGIDTWSRFKRKVQVLQGQVRLDADTDVAIVSWKALTQPHLMAQLIQRMWDLIIPDEAHNAKAFSAGRTRSLYGVLVEDGAHLETRTALVSRCKACWPLTGTPMPNTPMDVYPMLRALAENRLYANPAKGWPEVLTQTAFQNRYCVMKPKRYGARVEMKFVAGQNLEELAERQAGFFLMRTQKDVGITEPIQELMPIEISDAIRSQIVKLGDEAKVMAAIDAGTTKELEMELGPIRRFTGGLKAKALIEIVTDELVEGTTDKIVLMCWHIDTMDILEAGLQKFNPVRIAGSTTPKQREAHEASFRDDPNCRIAIGQIAAAGEAIDLSASSELIFVELSFTPKDMRQASLRITNYGQDRLPRVRVAVLERSLDEVMTGILVRKWGIIAKALQA